MITWKLVLNIATLWSKGWQTSVCISRGTGKWFNGFSSCLFSTTSCSWIHISLRLPVSRKHTNLWQHKGSNHLLWLTYSFLKTVAPRMNERWKQRDSGRSNDYSMHLSLGKLFAQQCSLFITSIEKPPALPELRRISTSKFLNVFIDRFQPFPR